MSKQERFVDRASATFGDLLDEIDRRFTNQQQTIERLQKENANHERTNRAMHKGLMERSRLGQGRRPGLYIVDDDGTANDYYVPEGRWTVYDIDQAAALLADFRGRRYEQEMDERNVREPANKDVNLRGLGSNSGEIWRAVDKALSGDSVAIIFIELEGPQ